MSFLIESLIEYVENQIKYVISASSEGEARFSLVGIPLVFLKQIMDYYQTEGGLYIRVNGNKFLIPVYLLEEVNSNPHGEESGSCNDAHLTNVRNNLPYFLVLVPPDKLESKSISSSTTVIDVQDPLEEQLKSEQGLAWDIIKEALACKGILNDIYVKIVINLIEDGKKLDDSNNNATQWEMLERVVEILNSSETGKSEVIAACGLPFITEVGETIQGAEKILSRLTDGMIEEGLNSFFEGLKEAVSDKFENDKDELKIIERALNGLKSHLNAHINTAQEFEVAPRVYYSPFHGSGSSHDLPEWWLELNVSRWELLLDEDAEEENLDVKLVNPLFIPKTSHPHVVADAAYFVVSTPPEAHAKKVSIYRGYSKGSMAHIDDLMVNEAVDWRDTNPPNNLDKALVYKFSVPDSNIKDCTIKIIILGNFVPGIVIDSKMAKKVSLPKQLKPSEDQRQVWECEMTLLGKEMNHIFNLYCNNNVSIDETYEYKRLNKKKTIEEGVIENKKPGEKQFDIEINEEGIIELKGFLEETIQDFSMQIRVHLEDLEVSGAASMFEILTKLHYEGSAILANHSIDLEWNLAQQLSSWILDDSKSFKPLVIGYDSKLCWKKPNWEYMPIISSYGFVNDIRPDDAMFKPPDELIKHREAIQDFLNQDEQEKATMELINLGELSENAEFHNYVFCYLKEYSKWLSQDKNNALWFDLVVVLETEATNSVLSQKPDAILLNPLHPIRLGWQVLAQDILYKALKKEEFCPIPGMFDPCATPDCMMLPCRSANQQIEELYFLSVPHNSSYWSVLWNGDRLESIGEHKTAAFFDDEFGIKLDGIETGFTSSQIKRALKDVSSIMSAKSHLKTYLVDDTSGGSSCTEGISEWVSENLGDVDPWKDAGQLHLDIYDNRDQLQWPSTRKVTNLIEDTNGAIRWFGNCNVDMGIVDLAIINHLGSMNPSLARDELQTAVSEGALIRKRIRRQLSTTSSYQAVSESRKSRDLNDEENSLSWQVGNLSARIESTCTENKSCYIFEPKMLRINEVMESSRYCAVSSSIVDPSCFFDTGHNSYLWDFEMPGYSTKIGDNIGYYLIASKTDAMVEAVRNNLCNMIAGESHVEDEIVEKILIEISGRGFPVLKNLATKGATSSGENGLLAALRLLQGSHMENETLFPIIKGKIINLLIPIDPFKDMIVSLKKSINLNESRPDILAVSIKYEQDTVNIKLTPIEVKYRSDTLSDGERKQALKQASEFAEFIIALEERLEADDIWEYAFLGLLSTMIDFGFRVNSMRLDNVSSSAWAEKHSIAMQAVMKGKVKWSIDQRGRLIFIDQTPSKAVDVDNDGFKESLAVNKEDAFKIITSGYEEFITKVKDTINDWQLMSGQEVPGNNLEKEASQGEGSSIAGYRSGSMESLDNEENQDEANNRDKKVQDSKGIHFLVGKDITSPFKENDVYFHPSNTQLNQLNIGIVGDLGTGKTQLTKSLVYNFVKSKHNNRGISPRFLIFDYKGDYLDQGFIQAVGGHVVKPSNIPLNLFDLKGRDQFANPIIATINSFNDILSKIYKVDKPNQKFLLKEAIKECYDSFNVKAGSYPTIYDVYKSYRVRNNGNVDSTMSTLSDIVDMELFEHRASEILSFNDFFSGVTVIDLKALGQDDNTKNMLVVIFLHLFYDYMLKIEKKEFVGDKVTLRAIDSMLLVDEANSIMKYNFEVLDNILLQGREFGVGTLLASQYLSHFKTKDKDYKEPLLTWFIHKVPNITRQDLEKIGFNITDNDTVERIKTLKLHECLYKTFNTDQNGVFLYGYPFYQVIKDEND